MNTTVGAPFCPNHWTQHKPTRWEQRQINQAVVRVVRLNTLLRLAHHEGHEGTRSAIVMRAAEEAQLDRFAKMARLKRRDDEYRRLGFLLVVTFALMDWQELARTWQKAVARALRLEVTRRRSVTERAQLARLDNFQRGTFGDMDHALLGFLLVVTFALMDWQELYRRWTDAIHPPPDGLRHWRAYLLTVGEFDEAGRLLRCDGERPERAATMIAGHTTDLRVVLGFINMRVHWFERRMRHPSWHHPEPLDLGRSWIHGRVVGSIDES